MTHLNYPFSKGTRAVKVFKKPKLSSERISDKSRMREAKRIRARDSLTVRRDNQNKKQNEKQIEKRNKKTNKPNEKQNKKGMEAEVKRKMANYEFLMSNHGDKPKNNGFDKHGHNDNA